MKCRVVPTRRVQIALKPMPSLYVYSLASHSQYLLFVVTDVFNQV